MYYQAFIILSISDTSCISDDLCKSTIETTCNEENINASAYGPVLIFFIAQFFFGMAISLFYSIGLAYLDDNVSRDNAPVCYSNAFNLPYVRFIIQFLFQLLSGVEELEDQF